MQLPQFGHSIASISIHVPFIADLTPFADIGTKGLAALLVIVLTAVNYIGVRFGGVGTERFYHCESGGDGGAFLDAFLLPTGGSVANLTTSSEVIHPSGLALFAGHGGGNAGGILGLRRLEQTDVHRRRGKTGRNGTSRSA